MRCGTPDKVGPEKLDDMSPCGARTRRQRLCVDAVKFEISVMWEEDDPTVVHGALKGGAERRGYDLRPAVAAHDRKHRAVGQVCVGPADAWECGPADQDPAFERLHPAVDDKVARELR